MQLYAAWKYPRRDMEALRPGPLVGRARAMAPDMLSANPSAPADTRRVGAFTVTPDVARRMLKGRIEGLERRRAEEAVVAATGLPHVRFVQLSIAWLGAHGEGPRLSPLYLPVFVYAYSHAGVKVRSFVSGVDAGRVSGAHYLDDAKVGALATLAATGALLLTGAAGGLSLLQLTGGRRATARRAGAARCALRLGRAAACAWARRSRPSRRPHTPRPTRNPPVVGLGLPFVVSRTIVRFWPALRGVMESAKGRLEGWWYTRGTSGETSAALAARGAGASCARPLPRSCTACVTASHTLGLTAPCPPLCAPPPPAPDWSAEFVSRYERQEEARRRAADADMGDGGGGGGGATFEDFMRDPLGWFEREMQRQQARAARQRAGEEAGFAGGGDADFQRRAREARRQQQQWSGARQQGGRGGARGAPGGGGGGGGGGPPGDALALYQRLGVARSASREEIAEAFRGLALKTHPDRVATADKAAATRRFQEITEAYQVLRNPAKRARYDATGAA